MVLPAVQRASIHTPRIAERSPKRGEAIPYQIYHHLVIPLLIGEASTLAAAYRYSVEIAPYGVIGITRYKVVLPIGRKAMGV